MNIERNNLITIAKLVVHEVFQLSLESQQLVVGDRCELNSPLRKNFTDAWELLCGRLLDVIEHCLCHGLRKDPLIAETVFTLSSDSHITKDNSFSPKSVLRRATEQVLSKANTLINASSNMPNPWSVVLHMEQMLPNVERISANINTMSEVRTGLGRCRVWIRKALMSKQLGTFFLHMAEFPEGSPLPSVHLPNEASGDDDSLTYVTCPGHVGFYHPESFMVNEECVTFCGLMSELSRVDFCFAVKGTLKDLDGRLRVLPYHLYLQDSTGSKVRSSNKPIDSLSTDMESIMGERKYLNDVNAKLLKRLEGSLASNRHLQNSLNNALASVDRMVVENRSLRITMDHLKKGCQAEPQRPANNGLSLANTAERSECIAAGSEPTEEVAQIVDLKERVRKLSLELELQTNLVSAQRNELSTMRIDHEQLSNLYSKLQSVVDQKDMVIIHLEDKNTGLVSDLDQLKERLERSEAQRSVCERDASRLRLEVASLEDRSGQQQTDIHAQRQMIRSLGGQLDERVEQLTGFEQCRKTLADYKQRNSQLSTALEKWRSRCEAQENSLSEMAAVVSSSKLEADSLRDRQSALVDARWVSDTEVEGCAHCEVRFSVTRRRHHCRNCGLVFCYACSSNTMQLPSSAKPVRVCEACHVLLMQRYATAQ